MFNVTDLRSTIVPKSDQINAEQLLTGPLTVVVTDVRVSDSPEQPVTIHYAGDDGRPYKPCKTMRKLMVFAWGQDGSTWAGKSMTLYNDASVRFGGSVVGGIRISHLSHIERDISISLTATKGKKALHTIKLLKTQPAAKTAAFNARTAIHNVRTQIKADDASSAAVYIEGLAETERDSILSALDQNEYDAIIDAWPKAEAQEASA
jgi:hypothetical protein